MPRGGKRPNAGRKRIHGEMPEANKRFATSVLARVGTPGWLDFADLKKAKCAEDYALGILAKNDGEAQSFFKYMLDRLYGKPAQGVFTGDTRETSPELDLGDLPMPARVASETGKPN